MDRPTQKTNQEPSSVNPNLPPELREAPVEPFSMSLEEANNLDRITTWPPVGASEPDYEALKTKPEKKNNKLFLKIGAGVAGLAIATSAAVIGVNNLNQPPKEEPVPTAPADPVETDPGTPAPVETEVPVANELEIPAGLDAESLGIAIVEDRWSEWNNAGKELDLQTLRYEANESWDDFLPKIAEENKEAYIKALYVDDWENNPNLVRDIENAYKANVSTLEWYVTTAWSGDEVPENKEGFKFWMTVESVKEVSSTADTRTIEVTYLNHDNTDLNNAPKIEKEGGVWSITTQVVDGVEKIVDSEVIQ